AQGHVPARPRCDQPAVCRRRRGAAGRDRRYAVALNHRETEEPMRMARRVTTWVLGSVAWLLLGACQSASGGAGFEEPGVNLGDPGCDVDTGCGECSSCFARCVCSTADTQACETACA